jgi:hypothetical protein
MTFPNVAQFISDNSNLSAEDKQAMLDDWCTATGVDLATNQDKVAFINSEIEKFIADRINDYRQRQAIALVSFNDFTFGV